MRSLLLAVGMLMAGNGLLAPLLGLEATAAGFSTIVTGLMLAAYYGGYLIGSAVVPGLIIRVGHIRVFAALAAGASATALVHGVIAEPVTWMAARLVTGTCMAGVFVVAESWLNGLATATDRGRSMSRYMFVLFAGLAVGQLLLTIDVPTVELIAVSSAVLSLAVVPVSLTRAVPPYAEDSRAVSLRRLVGFVPLSLAASTASGVLSGAILGFTAVYGVQVGLRVPQISLLLTVVVVAAAGVQLPLGALSDRLERRRVIASTALLAGAATAGAALLGDDPPYAALVALVAVGGSLGMALYGLGVAHAGDYLDADEVTGAGAKLVLVNGAGAAAGPLLAALLTDLVGAAAMFWMLAAVATPLGAYSLYRTTQRARAVDPAAFVPSASTMLTPVGAEVSAEVGAELAGDPA